MEVITLNKETFSTKCAELISKLDVQPELVVGILNGGGYLVDEMKDSLKNSHVKLIQFKRKTGLLDYFTSPFFLSLLPYKILNKLRTYQAIKAEKSISSLNINELSNYKLDLEPETMIKDSVKNIVIIDDSIDTGRTMFIVKGYLEKLFPEAKIRTAVISWTIQTSIVKPDYYLFKNVLVRFPWSKDYKG